MLTVTAINEVPKDPAVRRAWVIFQLRIRHSSLSKVGRKIGVTRTSVYNALMWPSRFAEEALADELGIPVQTLFPERFDANGERLHQMKPAYRSRGRRRRNVQVGKAS